MCNVFHFLVPIVRYFAQPLCKLVAGLREMGQIAQRQKPKIVSKMKLYLYDHFILGIHYSVRKEPLKIWTKK